jgi:hypothetical protein
LYTGYNVQSIKEEFYMKCSKCGADMPDDVNFCKECGAELNAQPAEEVAEDGTVEAVSEDTAEDEPVEEGEEVLEDGEEIEGEEAIEAEEEEHKPRFKLHINGEAFLFFGLAVIVLAIFLYAAYLMSGIGHNMYNMMVDMYGGAQSLDDSMSTAIKLQTASYNVGAVALRGLGLFCSAVLAWLGFRSNNVK